MPKRKIEVFTAGCSVCDKTVELVKSLACFGLRVRQHVLQSDDSRLSPRAI